MDGQNYINAALGWQLAHLLDSKFSGKGKLHAWAAVWGRPLLSDPWEVVCLHGIFVVGGQHVLQQCTAIGSASVCGHMVLLVEMHETLPQPRDGGRCRV